MKLKSLTLLTIVSSITLLFSVQSCKKDKPAVGIDKQLFDLAKETNGFTWYKNSDVLLNKSSGSGHTPPFLRTRYNALAAARLDSAGKVIPGSVFSEGSLIVKELINSNSDIERYAVLFKNSGDENADVRGWIWGYINGDGTVAIKASDKGAACTGCHLQADHIDYMLMNKSFP